MAARIPLEMQIAIGSAEVVGNQRRQRLRFLLAPLQHQLAVFDQDPINGIDLGADIFSGESPQLVRTGLKLRGSIKHVRLLRPRLSQMKPYGRTVAATFETEGN